jgi:hypothetical protein
MSAWGVVHEMPASHDRKKFAVRVSVPRDVADSHEKPFSRSVTRALGGHGTAYGKL